MIAWKFLGPGAVGLYSGFRWPAPENGGPGPWVSVEPPLVPSIRGVHASALDNLLEWLDDELWEIELQGEILSREGVLVASAGRLLRRVERWDAVAAQAFARACVLDVRDLVARALDGAGLAEHVEELAALDEPEALQRFAVQRLGRVGEAEHALAFLADCVELLRGGRPDAYADHPARDAPATPGAVAANLGYVAAAAVGAITAWLESDPAAFERGFDEERARQYAWLLQRLEL